jgi:ERCC4-type nuclease
MAEQAAKLRATYEKVVWIIEGNSYNGHIALESKVITGAINHPSHREPGHRGLQLIY